MQSNKKIIINKEGEIRIPFEYWGKMDNRKWERYNYGPATLIFFEKDGSYFHGTMEDFEKCYGPLYGIKNKVTNEIVLLSAGGYVVGEGYAETYEPKKHCIKIQDLRII